MGKRGLPAPSQATIVVEENKITVLKTGQVITKDPWGKPMDGYEIAYAIKNHARPGDVIGVKGEKFKGLSIGGGSTNQRSTVFWPNKEPVHDIEIIGLDANRGASMFSVTFSDTEGGADNVLFQNLTILGTERPISTTMNQIFGLLKFYDISVETSDPKAYKGRGMKWGIRGHGPAQWDLRYVDIGMTEEHAVYLDNIQGNSRFLYVTTHKSGRTGFQIVNRPKSGPSGFGRLQFFKCNVLGNDVWAGGGSDFTIAGHLGIVLIEECQSIGDPKKSSGAIAVWTDKDPKKGGAYLNKNGYSVDKIIIKDFIAIHPKSDRDHIQISGCERIVLDGFDVTGNKTAISLGWNGSGGIHNGTYNVKTPCPFALYEGFNSWKKMRTYNYSSRQAMWLDNGDINALAGC